MVVVPDLQILTLSWLVTAPDVKESDLSCSNMSFFFVWHRILYSSPCHDLLDPGDGLPWWWLDIRPLAKISSNQVVPLSASYSSERGIEDIGQLSETGDSRYS
jgi:hypothetical protein